MSQYKSPKAADEFIERTLKIIDQYKRCESYLGTEYYNVTLYLNCMLGLVVLPRENKIKSLPDKPLPEGIKKTLIRAIDNSGKELHNIKFKEYIIGLRNGIVHFGQNESLKFESKNGEIASIKIEGKTNNKHHTLTYQFDLESGDALEQVITHILEYSDIT